MNIVKRVKTRILGTISTERLPEIKKFNDIYNAGSFSSNLKTELYLEEDPHVLDCILSWIPNYTNIVNYFQSLFPFTQWIVNYNVTWLLGDLVAGITIGAVVVPQGMAYALLAGLPPQYGLYTSFIGVLVYWLFATTKDITIGPVAIVSVLLGGVVSKAKLTHPEIPGPVIASALTLVCGVIILLIGLLRCGWLVELIPLVTISAFTTGSAITITVGQIPGLLGIDKLANGATTYQIFINIFKNFQNTKLDAGIGLSSLILLYAIRSICIFGAKKFPTQEKRFFFISTLRTVFIILLYTMISWLINKNHRSKPLFSIISSIPTGFSAANVPTINGTILSIIASKIPVTIILMVMEHIAIAKIFGRINNYIINPSQEIVAIGTTNILGPFLGGFIATGSFSRTAIKSKAGVRSPLAGVITAAEVLLAIYALPAVFFYIPNSVLSAVIIHSVLDLITPPSTVLQFWRISPIEVPIFFIGVFVTIFTSIENGIYVTTALSFAILLIRLIKAQGKFLGKVKMYIATSESVISDDGQPYVASDNKISNCAITSQGLGSQNIFPPIDFSDGINPEIDIQNPPPGVFVYRFSQNLNYLSANNYLDQLTNHILAKTRRFNNNSYAKPGDRPWNDFSRAKISEKIIEQPMLRAIILDFSAVNEIDLTSMQKLVDVRSQFDLYASPGIVEWHFSNVSNRWTKRALIAAGFGYPSNLDKFQQTWKPVFGIAQISNQNSEQQTNLQNNPDTIHEYNDQSCKAGTVDLEKRYTPCMAIVSGFNRPYFHANLITAWLSVTAEVSES